MTPPDDDDRNDDFEPRPNQDDTAVDLDPSIDLELDEASPTPPRGVETLAGYEPGRRDERAELFENWEPIMAEVGHRFAARVLHELRDALAKQGMTPDFVDEFVRRIGVNAGVRFF